jgi:hypothetical protein
MHRFHVIQTFEHLLFFCETDNSLDRQTQDPDRPDFFSYHLGVLCHCGASCGLVACSILKGCFGPLFFSKQKIFGNSIARAPEHQFSWGLVLIGPEMCVKCGIDPYFVEFGPKIM